MIRAFAVAGGLMLLLPAVQGGDADKTAAQIKALVGAYERANAEFTKALKAARTVEERKDALAKRPNPSAYAGKLMALVEKDPKVPAGDALLWVAKYGGALPEPRMEKFLQQVLSDNPSKDAQGLAAYVLVKRYLTEADRSGRTRKQEEINTIYQKAEKLVQLIKSQYSAVKIGDGTLANQDEVFIVTNLIPGKVVPDIVGEDTDGKKFKLSDYRGKVVLLDYWGHW